MNVPETIDQLIIRYTAKHNWLRVAQTALDADMYYDAMVADQREPTNDYRRRYAFIEAELKRAYK